MAIAVDAVSGALSVGPVTNGTSTATHVVGGSATFAILVFASCASSADLLTVDDTHLSLSALTLGGNAFTHLASALKHSGGDSEIVGFLDLYYLANPPTGSQTLSVTYAATAPQARSFFRGFSVSFTGTLAGTALGTAKTSNGKLVSSLTLTDTLATGDLLLGIAGNGSAAPGVTTGTSDGTITGSVDTACDNVRVAHNSGTGSISVVFSTNSGDWSGATGVKLIADTGAAFIAPRAVNINQTVNTSRYF